METIVKIIARYANWIYATVAVVGLWYLREAWLARKERRRSLFSLEREMAENRIYSIYGVAFILLVVLGATYMTVRKVSPAVEAGSKEPSPAEMVASPTPLFLLATPTGAPTATPTPRPSPTRRRRPTRRPAPPPITHTPAPPPVKRPACSNPAAMLLEPGDGAVVSGVVTVKGTAAIPNFQYYKLEFGAGDNPHQWSFILNGKSPVSNGVLGTWNVAGLPPGRYTLRLVVVDMTGNYPTPCITHITVK